VRLHEAREHVLALALAAEGLDTALAKPLSDRYAAEVESRWQLFDDAIITLEALRHRGIVAHLVLGTWPATPELVHRTNLEDFPAELHGWLPENAANEPKFKGEAPRWLSPLLYGVSIGLPW